MIIHLHHVTIDDHCTDLTNHAVQWQRSNWRAIGAPIQCTSSGYTEYSTGMPMGGVNPCMSVCLV